VPADEPWWKTAVVYQIYPRSFADSNGDGIGDLPGIVGRLDYLAELGVDVLWLSPVYPSPQDDNGYDISDYQNIDPVFGTLDDFDRLVEEAHGRGLKIVMDLVVNHTSDEHPWFVESRSSKDNPKRDWYWWRPPRHNMVGGQPGAEPTNWRSFFSGPTWTFDEQTGEYYLHLFARKQPDLNWENPEVRQAIHAMMRWWIGRGVDGFRMDVINMVSKDTALPDGVALAGQALGDGSPFYICGPRVHEFLNEMNGAVFNGLGGPQGEASRGGPAGSPLLTVGEMPGVTVEQAVEFTSPDRREVDMVFQFEHVGLDQGASKWDIRPFRLRDLKATFGRWQAGLAEVGWNSLYWNNHDQPRVVSRFGDDSPEHRVHAATMLATVLHLHRGTPYIYQGEELGMTNVPFNGIGDFRDIESVNHYAEATAAGEDPAAVLVSLRKMSRDNARTPMQWDGSAHAGFTTGTPWIAVNPNYPDINAVPRNPVFDFYKRLIELRHTEPVVAHGDFTMLLPDDEKVYAFTRRLGDVELLVLGNFSGDPAPTGLSGQSDLVIANYPPDTADSIVLRPWEARVYRSRKTEGGA
jgi:oligo-1,6-glucosidase